MANKFDEELDELIKRGEREIEGGDLPEDEVEDELETPVEITGEGEVIELDEDPEDYPQEEDEGVVTEGLDIDEGRYIDDSEPEDVEEYDEEEEELEEPEETQSDTIEQTSELINNKTDSQGSLPPFLDGTMSDTKTREEAKVRNEFYEATGEPRVEDYVPVINDINRLDQAAEPEQPILGPSIYEDIAKGLKTQVNKAIRAFNDAADTDIAELENIQSKDDSELAEWVGSYGLLVGGGIAAGVVAPGWVGVGVATLGITGLHSWISTYGDQDENLEKYDSLIAELLPMWDGLFDDEPKPDMGRAEKAARIFIADALDTAFLGVAGVGLKKVAKGTFRALKKAIKNDPGIVKSEAGAAWRALDELGKNSQFHRERPFDVENIVSKNADEIDAAIAKSDAELEQIIGKVENVDYRTEVMELLHHRRQLLEGPGVLRQVRAWQVAMDASLNRIASGMNVNKYLRTPSTYDDYRRAAARSLGRVLKGEGDTLNELEKYKGYLYHKMRGPQTRPANAASQDIAAKVASKDISETFLTGTEEYGTELIANLDAQKSLFAKVIKEELKAKPNQQLVQSLRDAYTMTVKNAEQTASAAGGTLKRWEEYGDKIHHLRSVDADITAKIEMMKHADEATSQSLRKKIVKLEKKRNAIISMMTEDKEGLFDATLTLAIRSRIDNLLGGAALASAVLSGISTVGYEAAHYGIRHGRFFALPSLMKRSFKNTVQRLRSRYLTKKGRKEFMDEWTGQRSLGRQKVRTGAIRSAHPIAKGLNALSGTGVQAMREADYVLSAMMEPWAEQIALHRLIQAELNAGKSTKMIMEELKHALRFERGNLAFTLRWNEEVNRTTDFWLLRADPRESDSWLTKVGLFMHDTAESIKAKGRIGKVVGGSLGVFSRTFANTFMLVANNTVLGQVGAWKDTEGLPRRLFGTALALTGYFLWDTDDHDAPVDVVDVNRKSVQLARRYGVESGIRVGDTVYPWRDFGAWGEATRGLLMFRDMSELWYSDDYPMHDSTEKALESAVVALNYIAEDSWYNMGLGKFLVAMWMGDDQLVQMVKRFGHSFVPGSGMTNRVNTFVQGGAQPTSTQNAVSQFVRAMDEATPKSARRDMFGVPLSVGEDRYGTRENVDFHNRLIFMFNPLHKGPRPKSNKVAKRLIEWGAFNHSDVRAGDKWIPHDVFVKAIGVGQSNLTPPPRTTFNVKGQPVLLTPDGYNNLLGVLSLDSDFTQDIIDKYIVFHQNNEDAPNSNYRAQSIAQLQVFKEMLSPKEFGEFVGSYYPRYSKKTRMIDVMHHLLYDSVGSMSRDTAEAYKAYYAVYKEYVDAWPKRDPDAMHLTQSERKSLADRQARLMILSKMYRRVSGLAKRLMALSSDVDEENMTIIRATGAR